MLFWEGAFARQRRHHRDLEELGEAYQCVGGLSIKHSLTGVDDRAFGGQQGLRGSTNSLGVGGTAHKRRWLIDKIPTDLLPGYVRGDFQQDGAWPSRTQLGVCTPHQF